MKAPPERGGEQRRHRLRRLLQSPHGRIWPVWHHHSSKPAPTHWYRLPALPLSPGLESIHFLKAHHTLRFRSRVGHAPQILDGIAHRRYLDGAILRDAEPNPAAFLKAEPLPQLTGKGHLSFRGNRGFHGCGRFAKSQCHNISSLHYILYFLTS